MMGRMAARGGTSRDCRAAPSGPAPARALAAAHPPGRVRALPTVRSRAPAPVLAVLVACQPSAQGGPHRDRPDATSTGDADTGPALPGTESSGATVLDPDAAPPSFPAPDCSMQLLPGPASDVAATPRPDHDAEVLALQLDPARAAAPQAHYDVVTADLAAIRALDPSLADVHVGCEVPNGLAFWFYDDEPVSDALYAGSYHAWDCYNAYFRVRQTPRVHDVAVAIELDGVFGPVVAQIYAGLPGLADHTPYWFQRPEWPVPVHTGHDCTPVAGAITLTATRSPDGGLDQRDYRFERADGSSVVVRVTPDGPPEILR
jgi:hypothetical protein